VNCCDLRQRKLTININKNNNMAGNSAGCIKKEAQTQSYKKTTIKNVTLSSPNRGWVGKYI